jgi:hypothetical protein
MQVHFTSDIEIWVCYGVKAKVRRLIREHG